MLYAQHIKVGFHPSLFYIDRKCICLYFVKVEPLLQRGGYGLVEPSRNQRRWNLSPQEHRNLLREKFSYFEYYDTMTSSLRLQMHQLNFYETETFQLTFYNCIVSNSVIKK